MHFFFWRAERGYVKDIFILYYIMGMNFFLYLRSRLDRKICGLCLKYGRAYVYRVFFVPVYTFFHLKNPFLDVLSLYRI